MQYVHFLQPKKGQLFNKPHVTIRVKPLRQRQRMHVIIESWLSHVN